MKKIDQGIFLNRIPYSESSLIVTYYTYSNGLQKFIFQGAKKKKNPIFPLAIGELTYYQRSDSQLAKLTEVTPSIILTGILENPIKSTVAFFIADVLKQTLQTNQKESMLFSFLHHQIEELNQSDRIGLFPAQFLANYCEHLGIMPNLTDDIPKYFDLQEGEFHNDVRLGALTITGPNVESLYRLFQDQKIENNKEVLEVLLRYYALHIPKFNVTKSLEIIQTILYG